MTVTQPARKLRAAVERPGDLPVAAATVGSKLAWLLRKGRVGQAGGYLGEFLFGWNVYDRWGPDSDARFVHIDTAVGKMWVDREDPGISQTLYRYGVHERRTTQAYRRELVALSRRVRDPVVLDIGGNIGYFCLLEARALPHARIHVVEPVPENLRLLERNVFYHGFDDRVEVDDAAVAVTNGSARLYLSDYSNQHTLRLAADGGREAATVFADRESVDVETTTVQRLLTTRGLQPEDVNVLRMDLEGYEAVLLPEIHDILDAPRPFVLHIELHPLDMSDEEIRRLSRVLSDSGLEIASAVTHEATFGLSDAKSWNGCPVDVTMATLETFLLTATHSLELVLSK